MAVLCASVGALAVRWGAVAVSWPQIGGALRSAAAGLPLSAEESIVVQLRLPRVAGGLLTGAALGMSGAAMQGLLRNPLVEPYLMGVASGAVFGAALVLTAAGGEALGAAFGSQAPAQAPRLVPVAAFLGALSAVLASLWLSRTAGGRRSTDMVLAGVVVSSVLMAATTYLMLRDADRVRAVFSWSLGNLSSMGWPQLRLAAPYALVGMVLLGLSGRALNAMQLGEDVAASLGVPVERLKLGIIAAASLSTAAVVSAVGVVGFVGLVVPHVLRRVLGGDYRILLPASALGGGMLLMGADLLARVAVRPAELPVGVVTALIGGPFFLYLLRRGNGHAGA